MEKNTTSKTLNNTTPNQSNNITDSLPSSAKGYQGHITSKEAGNMVRDMIREQEKALIEKYR